MTASAFVAAARARLHAVPRRAGYDGHGDFAITGLAMLPEQVERLIAAAVLIAIRQDTCAVIFTKRSKHLSKHPGQIAFPGGRIDLNDDGPLAAAMREAEEEIGLSRENMLPLGYLDEYFTGTGFRVTPVIALITETPNLVANPHEVDEIFDVPLDFLMDRSNHRSHVIDVGGTSRRTLAIPYKDHHIWGVTAGIIRQLSELVYP